MSKASWRIRAARRSDRARLRRFKCARDDSKAQIEVEEFIQGRALDWAFEPLAQEGDPRLLLLFDGTGRLVGVAAHERKTLQAPGGETFAASKLERARKAGHAPLLAEARLVEALLVAEPGPRARALLEAIAAAELAGHDAARAEALLLLAKGQAGDERDRTLQLAQGALKRAGPDPRIERMIGLELGAAPP